MAEIKNHLEVKLFVAVLFRDKNILDSALQKLSEYFGEIDFESGEYDFSFTHYYENEMGSGLKKKFFSFEKLINREELPEIKLLTNSTELEFSANDRRKVNIDPGYLTAHNIVVASAKELSHRMFIGKGIFGDIQLIFKNNNFSPLPTTFADYRQEKIINLFNVIRQKYLSQLRE